MPRTLPFVLLLLLFHSTWLLAAPPPLAPPLSLTASDGAGLTLVSLNARAVVEDPLALTELHLTFHNPETRQREGQFAITLPPGAVVSRFAMRQSWGWQEGEVVELQAARRAYEDFLHRRQDPALLEKQPGNTFHARVFPIAPAADKEIIITYSQELVRADEPYRLPLRGLPKLGQLDIKVLVGKRALQSAQSTLGGTLVSHEAVVVNKRDFTPDVDFAVPLPPADGGQRLGLRHQNLVVARITPITEAAPAPLTDLFILLDSSASRALGYAQQVERLAGIIAELRTTYGAELPIKVACFDQEVVEIYTGPVGGWKPEALAAIRERRALGASDLGAALRYAGTLPGASATRQWSRVLLVSDGIATAGNTELAELKKAVLALGPAGVRRLDVVVTGGIRDEAMLKGLTTAGLPQAGIVLDDALGAAVVVKRLAQATFSGIKLSVPGAAWLWPQELNGLQPGDEALVYVDLPPAQALEIVLAGARSGRQAVKLAPVARPLLERAWVNARMQRLQYQRQSLAAGDSDLSEALKKQIIDISIKYRVLCDYTALLVLETEQDYTRFQIDRRALTDILTVGSDGVELLHRTDLGLAPPPATGVGEGQVRAPVGDAAVPQERPVEQKNLGPNESIPSDAKPAALDRAAPRPAIPAPGSSSTDADGDGIPDAVDKCPNEPETFNGFEDEDGCPDRGRIIVRRASLEILDKVYFGRNEAAIKPISQPILDAVAATLKGNPEILRIGIEGHTDERERAPLADQRAAAVKRYLVGKGVAAERLDAHGYGRERPVCIEHNEDCWSRNRRSEFVILVRNDNGTVRSTPSPPPPVPAPAPTLESRPYAGRFDDVMALLKSEKAAEAERSALAWHDAEPGDVLALIALGESLEARGKKLAAARAYGSVIDLFPGRADLRRFAGERLERLEDAGLALAIDTYKQARAQRPDHPASHRLLAYALLRAGQAGAALDVILDGCGRAYPPGRFAGVAQILNEDAGLIAAALLKNAPTRRPEIEEKLRGLGLQPSTERSVRFVLNWETDANDVDFHIFDARGSHAFYSQKNLASGGQLYADVTTGYGPECFTISGVPHAYPYRLQAHYYSRGPMGYGMGKLEIIEHDGQGSLRFEERPFVIMTDQAFIELGTIKGPLAAK